MLSPKGILLDIEGTTSSISFVHDVMFPFVRTRIGAFLAEHFHREDVQQACQQIAKDAGHESLETWSAANQGRSPIELVLENVYALMDADAKATGLKALQGLIWHGGFQSRALKAHVYPDVLPAINQWRAAGIDVRIYSSGSIAAQKLFFGHVDGAGDCLHLFSGHYDTTIGNKKAADSYRAVAADWGFNPDEILFISDIADELLAAAEAGLQTLASMRPGNAALPDSLVCQKVNSFDQVMT